MKLQLKIEIADEPKLDETEFIVQQLIQFNSRCAGKGNDTTSRLHTDRIPLLSKIREENL